MTNKFREKFFFYILTSIATMLVIFLLPLVFGDSHISNWYFEKVSSVLITYKIELLYLQLSILTGLCIYVYRKRKVKGLLSEQPSHHRLNYQRVLLAQTEGADREGKSHCYKIVQQLLEESKQQNGSIICAEILGLNGHEKAVNSYVASERTAEYYKSRPCVAKVESAARIFAEYLEKKQSEG